MRKPWLLFVLMALMALSACAPQATAVPTAVKTATQPTAPAATQPNAAAPAGEPTQAQFQASGPATCTTKNSLLPAVDPTVVALFPPITEKDHVQGPATANVTIVEYSDYQ